VNTSDAKKRRKPGLEFPLSNTALSPAETHLSEWLGLALTPGLGPTKSRKLVEHFGSVDRVFRASLTELEGAGIQAVSAQSLATGKSGELAREEMARAAELGVTIVSMDDPSYPPRLKESTILRSCFTSAELSKY
jgi:predicted Rossmann fold nucleotide-binding protein DprA/Smf involved in DNA uptake